MTVRIHLFPFRTQKLSSLVPTILGGKLPGKIGRCRLIYSSLAQSVERVTVNHDVVGSSPTGGATRRGLERIRAPGLFFLFALLARVCSLCRKGIFDLCAHMDGITPVGMGVYFCCQRLYLPASFMQFIYLIPVKIASECIDKFIFEIPHECRHFR